MSRRRALAPALLLLATPTLRAAPEEQWLRDARALTTAAEFQKAGEAYFAPDGKRIVFQAVPVGAAAPWYQIWVMNADGSGKRLISTGQGKTTCAFFHPQDPNRFIYASTHLDPSTHGPPASPPQGRSYQWDYDPAFDVFEADLTTGKVLRRLTEAPGYDAECSYSPDGKKICFTSRRESGDSDIWLMNADGSEQRILVRAEGTDGGPFFSPDGAWVLYRAARGKDDSVMQVYMTSLDGKQTRQITDSPRVNWAPFFHPQGQVVVFSANAEGHEFELWLVKTDGSRREARLTTTRSFDGLPSFSPDGKRLVWTSNRAGTSQVWVADFVMPPEEAFQVPAAAPAGDPHGGGEKNPHGGGEKDPHGAGAPKEGSMAPVLPRAGSAGNASVAGLDAIDRAAILGDVRWLADDALEGRRAGTPAGSAAAAWIAARFQAAGAEPGAAEGRWLQSFEFPQGARRSPQGNALECADQAWALDQEWAPLLYSKSAQVEGELCLAGFAVRAPEQGHDDLAGLDLTGKVALVLTGSPRDAQGGAFGSQHPTVWDDLRYKVGVCRDAGAVAVVLVRSRGQGWLKLEAGEPGLPVAQLDAATLQARLGLDPAELANAISARGPASRPLGKRLKLGVAIERVRGLAENVVARIPGSGGGEEVIVVGAHYDHLGHGGEGSLAPDSKEIHNGADDNASGTAGLLALARALKQHPPRRTVLLVAFGAEEVGLIGSQRFVEAPPLPLTRVAAMINLDMIGRLDGRPLVVGGAGTASEWGPLLQAAADATGQALQPQADGMGPSDHASFYKVGVPVLFLFSGNHPDYHRPSDDVERLDVPGAERATRVALALLRGIDGLPARPTYVKVARPDAPRMVATGEQGAYFGSVPDYAAEGVEGVRLSGARAGTPAEQAGIKPGDVIVEFAGKRVVTIHDYVNALRLSRPGQTVKVAVLREGKRVELEATLVGR